MARKHKSAAYRAAVGGSLAPAPPVPVLTPDAGARRYSIGRISPSVVVEGRVENRDEVVRQFGSWEGLSIYARMLRQFPFLYGICQQWIARISSIDRGIKAGDPENETSVQMMRDAQSLFRRLDGKETITQRLLWGRFFGIAGAEKVWEKDAQTGLLAPMKLYDLEPWTWKFGPGGETYVLTEQESSKGELCTDADRRFMFFRWGSRHTGYGAGDLKFAYMPTWYIQQVLRFGLQAIERFGRPIPWVRYSAALGPEEKADLESSLSKQFVSYLITPQQSPTTDVEFPAQSITAAGAAGRPELEFVRFMEGWCFVALNLVQQTQDRAGGSRALEQTRSDIADDQTPPGSQALDTVWTRQWLDQIGEVNWASQPREMWPYFDSDTSEVAQAGLSGARANAALVAGERLASNTITDVFAEELLCATGIPRQRAAKMVASMMAGRDALTPVAKPVNPFAPPEPPSLPPIEEHDSEDAA